MKLQSSVAVATKKEKVWIPRAPWRGLFWSSTDFYVNMESPNAERGTTTAHSESSRRFQLFLSGHFVGFPLLRFDTCHKRWRLLLRYHSSRATRGRRDSSPAHRVLSTLETLLIRRTNSCSKDHSSGAASPWMFPWMVTLKTTSMFSLCRCIKRSKRACLPQTTVRFRTCC